MTPGHPMEGFAPGWKLLALLSLDGRIEVVANWFRRTRAVNMRIPAFRSLGVEAVE